MGCSQAMPGMLAVWCEEVHALTPLALATVGATLLRHSTKQLGWNADRDTACVVANLRLSL